MSNILLEQYQYFAIYFPGKINIYFSQFAISILKIRLICIPVAESLEYLDSILPEGSGVVVTGLAQGAVLWDTLHDRLYPFGEFDGAGTYSDFYGYMECLQVSPCMGWMSADPERRARTTKREQELSQAAEELVNEQKGLNSYHRKLNWK